MATRWLTLADLDHVAATARADDAARRDHTLDARQAFRQGACLALFARRLLFRTGRAGRDLFLDGGNLFPGLGDGRLEVLQRQFQLRRVQLLGLRPELGAPVVLNLALQLLDQRLQVADEGVLLGNHRLLVLACRALDSRLEPGRLQCRLLGGKGPSPPQAEGPETG